MGRQDSTAQPHPAGSTAQAEAGSGTGVLVGCGAVEDPGVVIGGAPLPVEPPQLASAMVRHAITQSRINSIGNLDTRFSYSKRIF